MDYLLVTSASLLVAALTLFSGFGLGTLLLPVFALFFPLPLAVGATAIVHLANNLFKLILVGRHASAPVILRFGVPAIPAAFVGAIVLLQISGRTPLVTYHLGGRAFDLTWIGLAMGTLLTIFALADLLPWFENLRVAPKWLLVGGGISGFFGGVSGHQGALRAAFLSNCGLSRDAFIGTSVVCATLVDLTRLGVYGLTVFQHDATGLRDPKTQSLLLAATLAAFVGSFLGARLVKKVTLETVRRVVGALLLVLGLGIGAGLL